MKLYGKELDEELAKRKLAKEERRSRRSTLRNEAMLRQMKAEELIAYEHGEDVCPHEKWIDQVGGFPIPKFIIKVCAKCGKIDNHSMERVGEGNWQRVREVCKREDAKLGGRRSVS